MIIIFVLSFFISDLIDTNFNWFYFQDTRDQIWISSESGWNKFNGIYSKPYKIDKEQLKGNYIQGRFFEDESGKLYSSTYEFLTIYDPVSDQFESIQLILNDNIILKKGYHVFHIDTINHLLFLKIDDTVYSYNYEERKIVDRLFQTNSTRFTISEDQKIIVGSLWGLDYGCELFELKNNTWTKKIIAQNFIKNDSFSLPNVKKTLLIENDVWMASNKGLFKYNLDSNNLTQTLTKEGNYYYINDAILYEDKLLLSTDGHGLVFYDLIKNKYWIPERLKRINKKLSSNSPKQLFIDSEDNLYISYDANPIQRVRLNLYLEKKALNGFQHLRDIKKIIALNNKKALIACSNVLKISTTHEIKDSIPIPALKQTNNGLHDVIKINNDEVWISSTNKIYRVRISSKKVEPLFSFNEQNYYLNKSTDKNVYVSSTDGLFNINIKNLSIDTVLLTPDINTNFTHVFQHNNLIYYATTDNRIIVSDLNGKVIGENNFGYINQIGNFNAKNNRIISSSTGTYFLNDQFEKTKIIDKHNFLSGTQNFILDQNNILWIITENGIFYRSENEILRVPFSQDITFNKFSPIIIDNTIWVSTSTDIYQINPEKFIGKKNKPILSLENLKINNIETEKSNKLISVGNRQEDFNFQFSITDLGSDQFSFLKSRLIGEQEDWVFHEEQEVSYNNLKPGNYTLQVYAVGSNFNESDLFTQEIYIAPPFHQTWWFRTLIALSLIAIGLAIQYYRNKEELRKKQIELDRQKALQTQRNRMSNDLHDEMGSGLSAIRFISKSIEETRLHGKVSQIENITSGLIQNMRDLLWSLDESNDTITDFHSKVRETINQLCRHTDLTTSLDLSKNYNDSKISGFIRRNLILVLKECITNTLRHSKADSIKVSSTISESQLQIIIQDDGIGFNVEEAQLKKGSYGLKSLKKRIKEIDGQLSINSSSKGTIIRLTAPLIAYD